MTDSAKYSRFAHSEGHTAARYTRDGRYIITCGTDPDVRLWHSYGIEETDTPSSITLTEPSTCVTECNDTIFIGSGNFVHSFNYPDLTSKEKPLRFTATVTAVDVSSDGQVLAAGASDMKIQVKKLVTGEVTELSGHEGPILSVSLNKAKDLLASSSGDKTVRVWNISTGDILQTYNNVPFVNDFFSATCFCNPVWHESNLIVPDDKRVCFYNVSEWSFSFNLTSSRMKQSISVISLAPIGALLCAGTKGGEVIVWNIRSKTVIRFVKDGSQATILSMSWNPTRIEFAASDRLGRLFVISAEHTDEMLEQEAENLEALEDVGGEEIPIESISDNLALRNDDICSDDGDSVSSRDQIRYDLQPAFQPSSTPHLSFGYMVWNSIGIVKSYNKDKDVSIDVEFNDPLVHHAIHRPNQNDYIMAALTRKVLCLASTSLLTCVVLKAWDDKKEWSVELPEDETIDCLTSAGDWVCIATDLNQLRFYGITGMQRQIISISGPVVCISGYENRLIVIHHLGVGIPRYQNLGYTVFEIGDFFIKSITPCQPLPMSPESKLKWAGFTDEGTPCTYDSAGIVRLSRNLLNWDVVCCTRTNLNSESDNYFMLGASERFQSVRCVLCKGSWYPVLIPRPITVEIPFKLPLCNEHEPKTSMEDIFLRHVYSLPALVELSRELNEYRLAMLDWEKLLRATIMKLFAEAHRCKADMRAVHLATLMPEDTLELAFNLMQEEGRTFIVDKMRSIKARDWKELQVPDMNTEKMSNVVVVHDVQAERVKQIRNPPVRLPRRPKPPEPKRKESGDMFELSQPSQSELMMCTEERNILSLQPKFEEANAHQGDKDPVKVSPPKRRSVNPFKIIRKEDKEGGKMNGCQKKPEASTSKENKRRLESDSSDNSILSPKMKFFEWFKINKSSLEAKFPGVGTQYIIKEGLKIFKEEEEEKERQASSGDLFASQMWNETKKIKLNGSETNKKELCSELTMLEQVELYQYLHS